MPNKYTQPPRENKNVAASPNLPVKTFRLGRIKAAVWENETTRNSIASPSPGPIWTRLTSITIPIASVVMTSRWSAKLADQAHTFIFERLAELKNRQSE
jgi:hypothetical protein